MRIGLSFLIVLGYFGAGPFIAIAPIEYPGGGICICDAGMLLP
jgi:hypothetical protein